MVDEGNRYCGFSGPHLVTEESPPISVSTLVEAISIIFY